MRVGASAQPQGTLVEGTFRQRCGETVHRRLTLLLQRLCVGSDTLAEFAKSNEAKARSVLRSYKGAQIWHSIRRLRCNAPMGKMVRHPSTVTFEAHMRLTYAFRIIFLTHRMAGLASNSWSDRTSLPRQRPLPAHERAVISASFPNLFR